MKWDLNLEETGRSEAESGRRWEKMKEEEDGKKKSEKVIRIR